MEELIVKILGLVFLVLSIGLISFSIGSSLYFKFSLYFLHLNFKDHPLLVRKVEKVLNDICETENLKVFHVPYAVLNEKTTDSEPKAIGRYIYSTDMEKSIEKIEEVKMDIQKMELKYGKPYNQLCVEMGLTPIGEERLYLPRIMLTEEMEKYGGIEHYFGTYFHELGHHFVVKTIGATVDHTEKDADDWAAKLIKEHLPKYFLLFFSFPYRYRENGLTLTKKEKVKAFIEFLDYLKEKRKFDENLKRNGTEVCN